MISKTAFNRSLTTLSDPFLPASLISFILISASLFASSSAFLLPLVCYSPILAPIPYHIHQPPSLGRGKLQFRASTYLRLELLELPVLVFPICINLLLRLVSRLLYTLCAIYTSQLFLSFTCFLKALTFSSYNPVSSHSIPFQTEKLTSLDNFLRLPLSLLPSASACISHPNAHGSYLHQVASECPPNSVPTAHKISLAP